MIFKFSYSYIITFFRYKKFGDMYTLPYLFIYLGAFSSCGKRELLTTAMHWLLIALLLSLHSTASRHAGCIVAAHSLSSCHVLLSGARLQELQHRGSLVVVHRH